ncbi:hypothetical protein K6T79_14485, partial [Mycolicibacter sp. MYC098]|nr:hypothetical protein [Mycolicibacter sp. MYC098]
MADSEPVIVVLGPFGGGTSAVGGVLRHLGVFMGRGFDWAWREPHETWEDSRISTLFRRAFTVPGGRLHIDADILIAKLRDWSDGHRQAARAAGQPPGVNQPLLCVALDDLRAAWGGPVVPVVVDRSVHDAVRTLNRLGWWADEQERLASVTHLIAERDRALAGTAPIRVDFDDLCAEPDAVIRRLATELGLSVTDAQVDEAVVSVVQATDVGGGDPYGENLLLARVERDPDDRPAINLLAQLYYGILDDPARARTWYARWLETSDGSPEVIYEAKYRLAKSMDKCGDPRPQVRDAYLRAYECRPTRAEPLYAIARRYHIDAEYRLGHLFASRAAAIPLPEGDLLLDQPDVYTWKALDEQAVCASQCGEHPEAFALFRRLVAQPETPDAHRPRMANNRDFSVPAMLAAASSYPEAVVRGLPASRPDSGVTVSVIAGPDRGEVE